MPIARFKDLCIDANDVELIARFWAGALDLTAQPRDEHVQRLTGPTPQHTVWINEVPEPVTVKQRVHLDVHAAAVDDVLALGATEPEKIEGWTVVRDPEGGELCVFEREQVPANRLYEIIVDTGPDFATLAQWWGDLLGAEVDHFAADASSVEKIPVARPPEGKSTGTITGPETSVRARCDATSEGAITAASARRPDPPVRSATRAATPVSATLATSRLWSVDPAACTIATARRCVAKVSPTAGESVAARRTRSTALRAAPVFTASVSATRARAVSRSCSSAARSAGDIAKPDACAAQRSTTSPTVTRSPGVVLSMVRAIGSVEVIGSSSGSVAAAHWTSRREGCSFARNKK